MNRVITAPFDTPERLIRAQDLNAAGRARTVFRGC